LVSRVRASEVVDEALGIAKYYHRTKQRTITTDIPADLPAVVGVRDYLTQDVLNQVLNAVDATVDQGRIHVAGREENGFLVLSVDDDGRGISIADRCRLFQPYFTTKAHGTGLGLFVSRQILEDFAGTLRFVSKPGQGSTFVVSLPIERAGRKRTEKDSSGQPRQGFAELFRPHDPALSQVQLEHAAASPATGASVPNEVHAANPREN
jgi:signal transduction histidine kinase